MRTTGSYIVGAALRSCNLASYPGDGVTGAPSIRIVLSEQRAYFYKGKQLVGEFKAKYPSALGIAEVSPVKQAWSGIVG